MSLQGKVIVMNGATSGLGVPGARAFAKLGARLLIIARSQSLGDKLLQTLQSDSDAAGFSKQKHSLYLADFAKISDVERVVQEIKAAESFVDILINNAGALFRERRESAEGFELTFAVNHLAIFALTLGLEDLLAAAPNGARVVITASFTHKTVKYDPDDIQLTKKKYEPNHAYSRSKFFNNLFTRSLAEKWKGKKITVNCYDPGLVDTGFSPGELGPAEPVLRFAIRLFGRKKEKGAETMVWLATSPDVAQTTGQYFKDRKIDKSLTKEAQNPSYADDLWTKTAEALESVKAR